jgi:exopolysaccharide production protein ExoZ
MDHQSSSLTQDSASLVSIQFLRAAAALGVAALHTRGVVCERVESPDALPNLVLGAAGVDLFFVISGFIIVYSSEALFGRLGAPRIFFARRLARIVPLYWAATLVLILYLLLQKFDLETLGISPTLIVASFAFVPYPRISGELVPVHVLGWTLNYEMFFYAIFAVAIMLPRRLAVLAVCLLFAAMIASSQVLGPFPQPLAFWSEPVILEFCFGMLIAVAYRANVRLPKLAAPRLDIGRCCRLWRVCHSRGFVPEIHPMGRAGRRRGRRRRSHAHRADVGALESATLIPR